MTAEAYAMREGLLLAQHIGCNHFTIQSDNTEVVNAMMIPLVLFYPFL